MSALKKTTQGWINIHVVGGDDQVMKAQLSDQPHQFQVFTVSEMVRVIIAECSRTNSLILDLIITAHADWSGFLIGPLYPAVAGGNVVHLKTLPTYAIELEKLKPLLRPGVSRVIFHSCELGHNETLLKKLSQLWGGVQVTAYRQTQYAPLSRHGFVGEYRTCTIKNCVSGNQDASSL